MAALLRLASWLILAAVGSFVLLGLWTLLVEGDVNLEPSMLIVPALGALAVAVLRVLRGPAPASPSPGVQIAREPAVRIAAVLSGSYGLYVLADLFRPRLSPADPALYLFGDLAPVVARVVFWAVLSSWLALVLLALAARTGRRAPGRLVVVAVLLAPFTLWPLSTLVLHPILVLACAPSTAFALWTVRRTQRYRRLPLWVLLAAFGWGAVVGTGVAGSLLGLFVDVAAAVVFNGGENLLGAIQGMKNAATVHAAVVEELTKGAGIAMAFVLLRRHLGGVVAGIVLGAAVGLGFNLVESVEFMAEGDGANAPFQYWMRQSVGLLAAHTAFSAIVGGGFGVASQLRDPRLRRLAIACGFVTATGAHVATNQLSTWYSQAKTELLAPSEALDILVLQPLLFLLLQGPLVVLSVLLVRRGLRAEAAELATALQAEAATELGAVEAVEIPALLDPASRLWLTVTVLRRHGRAAVLLLWQVQVAQLDLAAHRGHRDREDADPGGEAEQALRERVLRLKHAQPAGDPDARRPIGTPA